MTKPIKIPNFPLKKDLQYTQCVDSQACPGGLENGRTVVDRNVQLMIDLDANNMPLRATAYEPNEAACSGVGIESSICQSKFIFIGPELDQLKKSSPILQMESSNLQMPTGGREEYSTKEFTEQKSSDNNLANRVDQHEMLPELLPRHLSSITVIDPYYMIGPIIACILVISATIACRLRKRSTVLNSIVKNKPKNPSTIARIYASTVQEQVSNPGITSADSNNETTGKRSRLDADQKLEEVLSRLDLLEQQMIGVLMESSIKRGEMDGSG